jgi:hypothetical protein
LTSDRCTVDCKLSFSKFVEDSGCGLFIDALTTMHWMDKKKKTNTLVQ